jgi:hypothetical protein
MTRDRQNRSRVIQSTGAADFRAVNKTIIAAVLLLLLVGVFAIRRPVSESVANPAAETATVHDSTTSSPEPIVEVSPAPPAAIQSAFQDSAVQVEDRKGEDTLPVADPAKTEASANFIQRLQELRALAARDPMAALEAALRWPAGDERDQALAAVCFGWAHSNPAEAVKMAQMLQQPQAVMENLVQQWSTSDKVSALVWANAQGAGDQHDQFIQRVAFVLSKTDPANAAGLVAEQIPPGPIQDEAVMTVLHQWANQNLVAAANWAATFPFRSDQLQERALEELEGIALFQKALSHQ